MVSLEHNLIKNINIGDEDQAHDIYRKIIRKLELKTFHTRCSSRIIKNYLISLNSIIYANYSHYPICKKKLFNLRNNFMEEIERHDSIEHLIILGEKIINSYIHNINEKGTITKNPIINDALNYINDNLETDLTLEEVAKSIHISKSYLSHLFSKCIGHSFSYYVSKVKIKKSKGLLINTHLSLMDIALECGFNSQSYFSSVFKKFEGMTPKEYRISYRKKPL